MRIALLGDIAFFGKYSLTDQGKTVFSYFEDVAKILHGFDLVVGNLESPLFAGNSPFGYKSAHIKADPKNVELLKYLNISVVNLANNHIFDHGIEGYRSTLAVLDKNGIGYFGTDNKQHHVTDQGNRIAFSGYCCYSTNACGYYDPRKGFGVNVLNGYDVEEALKVNHKNGLLNIASFHCGEEHVNYPNYDHVLLARKLASKVPYVLYGHHPHVLQGIESRSGAMMAYSLGNFCFDDVYTNKSRAPLIRQSDMNKKSVILILNVKESNLVGYEIIPLAAEGRMLKVGYNQEIIKDIKEYSSVLNSEENRYRTYRDELIKSYLTERKKNRDLNWYIKRLNYKSAGLLLSAKRNKDNYRCCVEDYIKDAS